MLEQFNASLIALINSIVDAKLANLAPPAATLTAAPAAADPFGGLGIGTTVGTAAPAIVEVTPQMIQELIIPLLSNEAVKARILAAMHGLGVNELPAAKPDQLPGLYAAFKAIADEVKGATAVAATAGGTTII